MTFKLNSIAIVGVLCLAGIEAQAELVAQWTMDDNGANTTVLEAVAANNGTFQDAAGDPNTAAHAAVGIIDGALEFDGVDDYVTTGFAGVNGTDARSVSLWIKGTSGDQDGNPYLVAWGEKESFTKGAAWRIRLNDNGDGIWGARIETNSSGFNGAVNVLDDQWNNIIVTWDGVMDTSIYINGVSDTTSDDLEVNTGPGASTAGDVWIGSAERFDTTGEGGAFDQDGRRFKGLIDDVRIYNTALTQDEIDELQVGSGVAGDFDGDLDVDGADFLEWQRDLGDATNLGLWESSYGTPAPAVAAFAAVPEPSSLLLVGVMALMAISKRL